jgi:oligopeptide/dipeptide ABC transporter ATP-binding protein
LKVTGLTVEYSTSLGRARALDNASLAIGKNKLICIVGESGCGKSTLALAIMGLLPPGVAGTTSGLIEYGSLDLNSLDEKKRREYRGTEIGMIFQEPLTSLNPVYKVGDQIEEAILVRMAREKGMKELAARSNVMQKTYTVNSTARTPRFRLRRRMPGELRNQVIEALKIVRMPDPEEIIERYPFELSGGMRQRVMIAMALAEKPSLLVADEPTTALDVTTQAQVLKLMRELMREVDASILMITHDMAVAAQVADQIVVMYAGDVVEDAGVFDLFSEPLHPYTKGLLSCIPTGSKDDAELNPIPGRLPDNKNLPVGCKFAARCQHAMDVCIKKRPRLIEAKPGHKVACFLYGE